MPFTSLPMMGNSTCLMISLSFEEGVLEDYSHFVQDTVQVVIAQPQLQHILIYHDGNILNSDLSDDLEAALVDTLNAMGDVTLPLILINSKLEETSDSIIQCYFAAFQKNNVVNQTTWLFATDSLLSNEALCELASYGAASADRLQIAPYLITGIKPNAFAPPPMADLVPIPAQVTTLALPLDFDGCTDNAMARARLIHYLCELLLKNRQVTCLNVFIGSLRQSLYLDFLNAVGHGFTGDTSYLSCNILGLEFMTQLRGALAVAFGAESPPSVIFQPVLSSDILNNLEIGTTFDQLSQEFNRDKSEKINHLVKILKLKGIIAAKSPSQLGQYLAENYKTLNTYLDASLTPTTVSVTNRDGSCVNLLNILGVEYGPGNSLGLQDILKTTTAWFIAQYMKASMADGHYGVLYVDDRADILSSLTTFFDKYRELLPTQCYFHGLHFDDRDMARPVHAANFLAPIQGTGLANPEYAAVLKKIARTLQAFPTPSDALIKTTLRQYGQCSELSKLLPNPPVQPTHVTSTVTAAPRPVSQIPLLVPIPRRPLPVTEITVPGNF